MERRARLRVWAPNATHTVEVETGGRRTALEREGDGGFWSGEVPGLAPGDDYWVALDRGDRFPDPTSRFQPEGVRGPSRVVEPAIAWSDQSWRGVELEDVVAYELHVGTFTPEGTLDAAAARLDHLAGLGVTAVELMPLADFPGDRGWGYDGVHLWAVHRAYGGPDALDRFVDAAHARGLAVLVDVVYNHLGPDGAVLPRLGPYLTDRHHTPWGPAVNLDGPDSDGVRELIAGNALMWMRDHHVDGLRLDAIHAIVDQSAVHLLEELAGRVRALEGELGRRLLLVAESDLNDPRVVRAAPEGGWGQDAQWSDDFHHALWTALTGDRAGYYADFGPLAEVARTLHRGVVYEGQRSRYRRSLHGRPYTGVGSHRLLGYLQNHDQVGNRATGERSTALLGPDALRAAAATVLLGPFTPMLFMGEEWGATTPFQYFTDHTDAELAAAVSRGRRSEFAAFGWRPEDVPDPQDHATFARSRLDWTEPEREPHASLLTWHRELIAIRRARRRGPSGWSPDGAGFAGVVCRTDDAARTLVLRCHGTVVAWNLGGAAAAVRLGGADRVLLSSVPGWAPPPSGEAVIPAGGTVVLAAGDGGPQG
ncbi:MAG TPA: malto-oligosyltrehalose trehalohydrolase [Candidatus Dormibacteraeota bacterium]|nr:malto-oligosyltrehalose trehalohydrolase [Candidatus Dormibacteraeota bacterium]